MKGRCSLANHGSWQHQPRTTQPQLSHGITAAVNTQLLQVSTMLQIIQMLVCKQCVHRLLIKGLLTGR